MIRKDGWDREGKRCQEDAAEFCVRMVGTMMRQLEP